MLAGRSMSGRMPWEWAAQRSRTIVEVLSAVGGWSSSPLCFRLPHHPMPALPTGVQPPVTISPGQPRGHGDGLCGRTESDPAVTVPSSAGGAGHKPAWLCLLALAAVGHWPGRGALARPCLSPRRCSRAGRCVVSVPPRGRRPGIGDLPSPPTASHGRPPRIAGTPARPSGITACLG